MKLAPRTSRTVALAGLVCATLATWATPHVAEADLATLEGSWDMTVTALEPPGLPPLRSLVSFLRGGDVIESRRGYLPFTPIGPILETAGHGVWQRRGRREFAASFRFLVQAAPNNPMFVSGDPLGTDSIRLRITLDHGDHFTGAFVSEARDENGILVFGASGTVEATRLHVEP
jgi:hypothetical protein